MSSMNHSLKHTVLALCLTACLAAVSLAGCTPGQKPAESGASSSTAGSGTTVSSRSSGTESHAASSDVPVSGEEQSATGQDKPGGTQSKPATTATTKGNVSSDGGENTGGIAQVTPPSKFTPANPPALASGIPQRTPKTLGNMTMNQVFYKPKQETGAIDYIDLRGVDGSVRIAALCMQGLVARNNTASIFFVTCDNDANWKEYMTSQYKIKFQEISVNEMFEKYAKFVKKLVVYEWPSGNADPYQMVMAINMAAVSDGLPVSDGLATLMIDEGWFPSNIAKEDITSRWSNRVEAYEWGIQNVLPQCNKNYVGACDTNDTIWDYLYATKSFSFWLDYTVDEEKKLIERILESGYTMPGLVFGYGDHGDELLHATGPKGFGYLVSDYFVNATYFASIPVSGKTYSQNTLNTSLKGQNGVMYVALYISDGDNIQFNQKASQSLWTNTTDRGKNPVGLELNPALYELAPPMLEWFESRRTKNDELMGGPAGFSYVWEDEFLGSAWDNWHGINNYFLGKAGMRVVASSRVPNSNAQNHFMQKSSIIGSLDWGDPFEGDQSFSGQAYLYDNKPIVVSSNCGQDIAKKLQGLRPDPSRPTFYSLCVTQAELGNVSGGYEKGYAYINSQIDELKKQYGDKIQFVLPSDLLCMAKNSL